MRRRRMGARTLIIIIIRIIRGPPIPFAPDAHMLAAPPLLVTSVLATAQAFQADADELTAGAIRLISGFLVAFLVWHLVRREPWPRPLRLRFAALHVVAAPISALTWLAVSSAFEALVSGRPFAAHVVDHSDDFLFLGVIAYAIVAGVSYATEATARAARAEALAARTQLAALRAQIHPHFVFNALHAVVQLIPTDPARAAEAAELVASLLRTTLEEDRDEVTLDDEWTFVSRFLELEHIRFGDRLRVRAEVDPELLGERIPSFALQTLVENAVRHGAAHRVAPTEIVVTVERTGPNLTLSVRNSGDGPPPAQVKNGAGTGGTGLSRLRERLAFLFGGAAHLTCGAREDGGYEAVLVVPRGRRAS